MLTVGDRQIERVHVIDDDPEARDAFGELIEDMGLEAKLVYDFWDVNLVQFMRSIPRTDAILCDLQLSKHQYSKCNGDQIVASGFRDGIPGALCTSYPETPVRRDYLRHIPSRIAWEDMTPALLEQAWKQSVQEMAGVLMPSRRPWRTLVRVDSIDEERQCFYAVVPAWKVRTKVRIYQDSLPDNIAELVRPGSRFHAEVNTGARDHGDLFFVNWEER